MTSTGMSFSSSYPGSHQPAPTTKLKIRDGAYIAPLDPAQPTWRLKQQVTRARCEAALHCSRTDAVLSHEAAAHIHGLPLWEAEPDITTVQRRTPHRVTYAYPVVDYPSASPADERPDAAQIRPGRRTVHRRRVQHLEDHEVVVIDGLRVTALQRTVIDCALDLHPRDALVVVDGYLRRCALASGSEDPESPRFRRAEKKARSELRACLARHRARRGRRRAETILEHASARSESPLESALRWVILQAGFPPPVLQLRVTGDRGYYRVDIAWPALAIFVEADGLMKYEARDGRVLAQEKMREDDLRRLGTVLRFVWREVAAVEPVVDALMQVFPDKIVANLHPVPGLLP
ncbi:hypothetical protein [Actinomyces slackii]|nr:hypothetical protein [Actinomyces slackii]